MDVPSTEKLVSEAYELIDTKYKDKFKNILGGCHCYPPTEWLGDVYILFRILLNENAIKSKDTEIKIQAYITYYSRWFQ